MIQSASIVNGPNGKQYISLGYGCFEIVGGTSLENPNNPGVDQVSEQANEQIVIPEPDIVLQECNASANEMAEIRSRLGKIEGLLEQVLQFAANFNKLMEVRNTGKAAAGKKLEAEVFPEYEALFPVATEDQLLVLECNLQNKQYRDRCFRYFDSQYSLTGKREGAPFFKTVLRKCLNPSILSPFSWKGNNRKNGKTQPAVPNRSFQSTFPYFVAFVHRVVCAADIAYTTETNGICFGQFLRQKNIEIQRYLEGNQNRRTACSRKRNVSVPVELGIVSSPRNPRLHVRHSVDASIEDAAENSDSE